MGAKRSAEMKYALHLVKRGSSVYEAAIKAKVYPSSIYNALRNKRKKTNQKTA